MIWFFLACFIITAAWLVFTMHLLGREKQRRMTAENALNAIYTRRGGIDEVVYWYVGVYPDTKPDDNQPDLTDRL